MFFTKKKCKKKIYFIENDHLFEGFSPKMTLSFPIYRYCQAKNASEKTPFPEQNMPESPQVESADPTSTSKDHHTNLILVTSIEHPTSFTVNYKNESNIMVETDSSIVSTK